MTALELLGFASGVVSVWLMTRESVWAWPVGLVNLAAYVIVFRDARLYADMGLQVVYAGFSVYGWLYWLRGGGERAVLPVTRAPRRALLAALTLGSLAFFGLGALLHRATDAVVPYLDAALSSFSLVAQALQTRKWIENWPVWIAVDVVYVGLYVTRQLYLTAVLYAVFLALAVSGWRAWHASLRQTEQT